jgi:hypothetical protein
MQRSAATWRTMMHVDKQGAKLVSHIMPVKAMKDRAN